jgi:hypothetical protein
LKLLVIPITPSIRGGNRLNGYYPLPPEGHHIKHRQWNDSWKASYWQGDRVYFSR